MSMEQAIDYALSEEKPMAPPASPRPAQGETSTGGQRLDLTRREKEVAALVAQGLPNRRIAQELFISERTVDHHVSNILKKLGLRSREQVAVQLAEIV